MSEVAKFGDVSGGLAGAGTARDLGGLVEEEIKRIFLVDGLAFMERQKGMEMRRTGLMEFFRNECGANRGKHFMFFEERQKGIRRRRIIRHVRGREEKMFIVK